MTLTLVHLLPELLGTYGDRGNVEIASWRLKQRGIAHEVITVHAGDRVPVSADLYFLGGGEDDAQVAAREILERDGAMRKVINNGGHIFAVCAGFQLLGASFPASGDRTIIGLGILPVDTFAATPRSVGELLSESTIGIGMFTGFENHAGQTGYLDEIQPLGNVISGVGNAQASTVDGVVTDQVVATYMHGPAFSRNPDLADWVLARKVGELKPLAAPIFTQLHQERVANIK
ncbi:MAG: glutamine amidotransferase [Actinobacteria bacterium]|nr:glutamine amidotransferase [Actinomycetota bacterium]